MSQVRSLVQRSSLWVSVSFWQHTETHHFSSSGAGGSSRRWNIFVRFFFFSFYLGSRCEATRRGQRLWQEPAGARLSLSQSYFVNLHLDPVRFLIQKNRREGDLAPAYLPFALPRYYVNNRKGEHLPKGRGPKGRTRWINVSAAKHWGGGGGQNKFTGAGRRQIRGIFSGGMVS